MIRGLKNGKKPRIHPTAYVDETALIVGDVVIGEGASVWPMAVARGDENYIRIGARTNVQDGSILHVTEEHPLIIGDGVTIGHRVILHGCTIGDNARIGMGAIILDGAVVEPESMVAAGALVPPGKTVPRGCLVMGVPFRIVREMGEEEVKDIYDNAEEYVNLVERFYR